MLNNETRYVYIHTYVYTHIFSGHGMTRLPPTGRQTQKERGWAHPLRALITPLFNLPLTSLLPITPCLTPAWTTCSCFGIFFHSAPTSSALNPVFFLAPPTCPWFLPFEWFFVASLDFSFCSLFVSAYCGPAFLPSYQINLLTLPAAVSAFGSSGHTHTHTHNLCFVDIFAGPLNN